MDTYQAVWPGSLSFALRAIGGHGWDLPRGDVGFEFEADDLAVWAQVGFGRAYKEFWSIFR